MKMADLAGWLCEKVWKSKWVMGGLSRIKWRRAKGRTWAIGVGLHLGCGHGALQDQKFEFVHTRVWYESSLTC